MNPSLAVIYGLVSAACWGTGDFLGGVASRRASVFTVVAVSQFTGIVLMGILAVLFTEEMPTFTQIAWGALAGVTGMVGLLALYQGLAAGQMSIVAPLTALIATIVPVLLGVILEGWPTLIQYVGFGFALVAVVLVSASDENSTGVRTDLRLPLVSGLGFGLFFVLMDQSSATTIFVPIVVARLASTSMLIVAIFWMGQKPVPQMNHLPVMVLSGLFDTGGNAFFALASQLGRLDISSILSSMYPVMTVLLAWGLLKEQVALRQWIGAAAALLAVVLITA